MVGLDEDALVCDFAEVYHLFCWRELPVRTAATLAMGLRPDSRIMQKLNGTPAPLNTILLAMIADCFRVLLWHGTKDGQKGKNPPESILQTILGSGKSKEKLKGFDSAEDFKKWREDMIGGKNG